jgi:hypothetical protein
VIRPEDEDGSGEATLRVETDPSAPRVIEMTVRATAAEGRSASLLAAIDLQGVVMALSAGVRSVPVGSREPDTAPAPRSSSESTSAEVRRTRSTVRKATPAKTASKTTGRKAADARAAGEISNAPSRRKSERPYRHMPDPAELAAAYEEVGTVTGLAQRYGVPRHTAQGWVARLRKLNQDQVTS